MAVTTILDMLEQAESPSESRHWSLDLKLSTYTVRDRPSEFTPDSWDDIVHSFLESERNYILDLDQMLVRSDDYCLNFVSHVARGLLAHYLRAAR